MNSVLAFKTILVDSHHLPAGTFLSEGDALEFFSAKDQPEEEMITQKEKPEEEIIRWILGSPAKDLLFDELKIEPDSFVDCSVKRPVIENPQEKPGDIDILVCDGGVAEHAIAFQCKPVTVTAFNQDGDDINKLPDIKDAVLQVNKQRDTFGFYKNYLMVIVKAYGRKRAESNILFRGPSQGTLKQIYEFPYRGRLHDDVGIIFLEIVQPTGKSFNRMAQINICVDKGAATLSQPSRLTNRVKDYMQRAGVS